LTLFGIGLQLGFNRRGRDAQRMQVAMMGSAIRRFGAISLPELLMLDIGREI
jgi:hypothetical protein